MRQRISNILSDSTLSLLLRFFVTLFLRMTGLSDSFVEQGFDPAITSYIHVLVWLPCVRGAAERSEAEGLFFHRTFYNPSVTAMPCHLPLHRGG